MASNHFTAYRTLRTGVVRVEAKLHDFAFPAHSHDHVCLGLVRQGEHDCRYGMRRHIVKTGALMLVNPGEVHDGRPSGRCGRSYIMLEIGADAFRSIILDAIGAERFEFKHPILHRPEVGDAMLAWLACLTEMDNQAERDSVAVLFGLLAGIRVRPKSGSVASDLALRVSRRMREQGPGADSMAELATELGVSRFQLVRAFRQTFGLTPEDFRRQLRIERARGLMSGPAGLAEISLAAGFADQSHMTREFRRLVGLSPGAYRQALQ